MDNRLKKTERIQIRLEIAPAPEQIENSLAIFPWRLEHSSCGW
jgi:hypothetical protein